MKKYIFRAGLVPVAVIACMALGACEKVDDVPPYKESSTTKAYKLPEPTLMTADETAEFNAIKAAYEAAMNNN